MNTIIRIVLAVLSAVLPAGLAPVPAAFAGEAEPYRLQPQDEIMLKAMRWDTESAGYRQWAGVSGTYVLGPDGGLMVPLGGRTQAAGLSPEQLAEQLSQYLHRSIGLPEPPHISIEVTGHLPVYVLGDAASPGAYPFRPGLTAQQALALAGGLLRLPLQDSSGNSLQPLRLEGDIRLLGSQIAALEEERRRLAADLQMLAADAAGAEGAPVLASDAPGGLEGDILAAAQAARAAQGSRIRELQEVLGRQIGHLSAQIDLRGKQIIRVREELETVSSLKERGLTVTARVSSLTSALNDLEAKQLELEIARLTARQQLNRAERDALALVDDARSAGLVRLNAVDQQIEGLGSRLETARLLHAEALAAGLPAGPDPGGETVVRYRITRNGAAEPAQAGARTLLQPGDTLEIERRFEWPRPGQ
jgi:protein involved in polysaccharide export with SLBB domain